VEQLPNTQAQKFDVLGTAGLTSLPSVVKDTAWLLLSQFAGRGTLIVSGAGIAWVMGANAFADFSYLALTSATLTTFFSLGAGTAITRYVAAGGNDRGAAEGSRILGSLALGLGGAILALTLVGLLPHSFLPNAVASLQAPLLVALAAQLVGYLALSVLAGEGRFSTTTGASVASGFVLLLLVATGLWTRSVILVIWAIPISQAALLVVAGRSCAPTIAGYLTNLSLRGLASEMSAVAGFSVPMFITSLLATTGPWALGLKLLSQSKSEFAAYSAGLQWLSLVLVLPGALTNAYLPRVFRMTAMGKDSATSSRTVTINALQSTGIAVAGAALLLPLSGWLIHLHGDVLRGKRDVFCAFIVAATIMSPINPLGNGILAKNGQVIWMALTALWCALLLVVAYLAPISTALSAGWDLCACYATLLILAVITHRQLTVSRC
jgi:O-antigen/teichoic acid export membrane protein